MSMVVGIALGFGSAFFASLTYLASRMFSARYPKSPLHLPALAHIVMGAFSLVLLPFYKPAVMPAWGAWFPTSLYCMIFYFIGQMGLIMALKSASASRVSPLLGIKIFMLALITMAVMGQVFTTMQWAAVVLSIAAAFLLSRTGEKLPAASWGWIIFACLNYCISDLNIKVLVQQFASMGLARSATFSVSICYIGTGLIGAGILAFLPRPEKGMWVRSIPFAGAWYASMLTLFACFAEIGVVFGSIVQSTRGIISILMVPLLIRTGYAHLEHKTSREVFFGRLAAAALMTAAIALYYLGH
jgi:hypothetical protein